ncbi:hypothetical protein HMPREF0591_1409 [Mycobacterium parascrofulaceum ATCC BAA-614]|uniref:Uncharacterized protein n=1 Tax=Mycobacterium parascrofulaceum ATCC BAA-614 TaxID=525368 RepID=D5P5G5_9MYCO|nr:hypothetical protein [Mycobacterium parascrofulaceum]EFG78678.1 hypothetical protein HMPREF0591_1409 [Mycobacterium parascrofulaceum ATCC BAA-614]
MGVTLRYDDLDRLAAQTIAQRITPWKEALTAANADLAQTRWKNYEIGLKTLGWLAGATEVYGSGGAQAAPASAWIFPGQLWVAWQAKSAAEPDSSVSTHDARHASSQLRLIAEKRGEQPPVGSFTALATPQSTISHAARAICQDHVYLVPLHAAVDLLTALERAWTQASSRGSAIDEAGVLATLTAEQCLPSQWMRRLTSQRLNTLGADGVEEAQ